MSPVSVGRAGQVLVHDGGRHVRVRRLGHAGDRRATLGFQRDEPGIGGAEPAAAEIERAQMILEVDVQPLAAGRTSAVRGDSREPCPDPASADPGSRQSVEQEGVDTPVPGNVHEARKLAVFPRADPAQAMPAHLGLPVIIQEPMTEAFSMQGIQFGVRERAAPRVIDHRATLRSDYDD